MLVGRFGDTTGRPYMEGRLFLPRLKLVGDISFLVDTGADGSVLSPADGQLIGVDYAKLRKPRSAGGIGGTSLMHPEPALILFAEIGVAIHGYEVQIAIAKPGRDIMDIPSLLGRDVIDHWMMTYDPPNSSLTFEVRTSDYRYPLSR